jgi:hypothetical protein
MSYLISIKHPFPYKIKMNLVWLLFSTSLIIHPRLNHARKVKTNLFKKRFLFKESFLKEENGEDGIRTHAPLRTNGFQDRLVMTTSIPLQTAMLHFLSQKCCLASISLSSFFVKHFFALFCKFILLLF